MIDRMSRSLDEDIADIADALIELVKILTRAQRDLDDAGELGHEVAGPVLELVKADILNVQLALSHLLLANARCRKRVEEGDMKSEVRLQVIMLAIKIAAVRGKKVVQSWMALEKQYRSTMN